VAGRLGEADLRWRAGAAATIVLAAGGYPGAYARGMPITGLEQAQDDVMVFHAGTRRIALMNQGAGEALFVTDGGRVLSVSAWGSDPSIARQRAYAAVERIHFEGMQFRRDIGAGRP